MFSKCESRHVSVRFRNSRLWGSLYSSSEQWISLDVMHWQGSPARRRQLQQLCPGAVNLTRSARYPYTHRTELATKGPSGPRYSQCTNCAINIVLISINNVILQLKWCCNQDHNLNYNFCDELLTIKWRL